jgi:hypothetical protein
LAAEPTPIAHVFVYTADTLGRSRFRGTRLTRGPPVTLDVDKLPDEDKQPGEKMPQAEKKNNYAKHIKRPSENDFLHTCVKHTGTVQSQ